MSNLQTYISERKKSFREKFVRDDGLMDKYTYLDTVDENGIPETVTTAEAIESFNEETIEGMMVIVREVVGDVMQEVEDEIPLMVKNNKTGDYSCAYCGIKPEAIKKFILQALNTKE